MQRGQLFVGAVLLGSMAPSDRVDAVQKKLDRVTAQVRLSINGPLPHSLLTGFHCQVTKLLQQACVGNELASFQPRLASAAAKLGLSAPGANESASSLQQNTQLIATENSAEAIGSWIGFCENTASRNSEDRLTCLGRKAVLLSLQLVSLYVPEIPIDPLAARQALARFSEATKTYHLSFEEMSIQWERSTLERTPSPLFAAFPRQNTLLAQDEHAETGKDRGLPHRASNLGLIAAFFREVNTFTREVVPPSKISRLLEDLENHNPLRPQEAAREAMLQQSILAFIQQLQIKFKGVEDLARPVIASLEIMSLGLQASVVAAQHKSLSDDQRHLRDLLQRAVMGPDKLAAAAIATLPLRLHPLSAHGIDAYILQLAASLIGYDPAQTSTSTAADIDARLEAFAELERSQAEERQRQEAEEQNIYKSKTTSVSLKGDDELQEDDFRAMFPDFSTDPLTDIAANTSVPGSGMKSQPALSESHRSTVLQLVLSIGQPHRTSKLFASLRQDFIDRWLPSNFEVLPDSIDRIAAHEAILRLHQKGPDSTSSPPGGFYKAPDLEQALLASSAVRALLNRLLQLIKDWPEQEVLHHIADRCRTVLQMHCGSPVPRLMSALEQLLAHTDDWEGFASSETSLRDHRAAMTSLIISWRRQELYSWKDLLDLQASEAARQTAKHFLPLYLATITASRSASFSNDASALSKHFEELIALIDSFMRSSPFGEYHSRLHVLSLLAAHVANLPEDAPQTHRWKASLSALLATACTFFGQFAEELTNHVSTQRRKFDEEIAAFVKLASWKDTNVHALRQSAQKTHRKLHKVVSAFRNLLQQKSDAFLAASPVIRSSQTLPSPLASAALRAYERVAVSVEDLSVFASSSEAHMCDLPQTLKIFESMAREQLDQTACVTTAEMAVDIAETITSQVQDFKSRTPSLMTKKNERTVKALLGEKQRAFADALKTMRDLGISSRHKGAESKAIDTELFQGGASPDCILRMDAAASTAADRLFSRMIGMVQHLRGSLPKRSSDIPLEGLLRSHAIVENLVSSIYHDRLATFEFAATFAPFSALCSHYRSLSQSQAATAFVLSSKSQHALSAAHSHSQALLESSNQLLKQCPHVLAEAQSTDDEKAELEGDIMALQQSLAKVARTLAEKLDQSNALSSMVVSTDDLTTLTDVLLELRRCHTQWVDFDHRWRIVRSFNIPVLQACTSLGTMLRELSEDLSSIPTSHLELSSDEQRQALERTRDFISSLLIAAQKVRALHASFYPLHEHKAFASEIKLHQAFRAVLREIKLAPFLQKLLPPAHARQALRVSDVWRTALPFASVLDTLISNHLMSSVHRHHAHLFLSVNLASIVLCLTERGFAQPEMADEEQDQEDAEGDSEDAELEGGTGLGDGSGAKDISEQLKDDEQIEELQQEETEAAEGEGETKGEDNAKEMADDFLGQLESLSAGSEGEDDGEDMEEPEHDETMGDVDQDRDETVDEKLWSGEQDQKPEASEQGPQRDEEDSGEAPQDQARNESTRDLAEKTEDTEKQDPDAQDETAGGEDEDIQESQEEPLDAVDGPTDAKQEQQDEHQADEIEPLEGAMDVEADGDVDDELEEDEATTANAEPQEKAEDSGENDPEDFLEADPSKDAEEDHDSSKSDAGMQEPMDAEEDPAQGDAGGEAAGDVAQPLGGEATSRDPQQLEQDASSMSAEDTEEAAERPSEETEDPLAQSAAADPSNQATRADPAPDTSASRQAADGASEELPSDKQAESKRSLGDALRDFRRDIERIFEGEQPDAQDTTQATDGQGDVEHVGQEDGSEMQALGSANAEEQSNVKGLQMDQDELTAADTGASEEVKEEPLAAQVMDQLNISQLLDDVKRETDLQNSKKPSAQNQVEGATEEHKAADAAAGSHEDDHGTVPATKESDAGDLDLEDRFAQFREAPQGLLDSASEIWQAYIAKTSELSFALCEQLRLILIPTLATRMRGDYRTGKRINMRQIIPFIASDFAKDKIWLRRTKPSARQYQVILAIDDSKSMAHSRSAHLAMQTVALLSSALTKLEVGDVSICRFGKEMEVLHAFGERTFSQQDGAGILSRLTFQQSSTNVLKLLQSSLSYLANARAQQSSSAGELWQLEIIISDGMCEVSAMVLCVFVFLRTYESFSPSRIMTAFAASFDRQASHVWSSSLSLWTQ